MKKQFTLFLGLLIIGLAMTTGVFAQTKEKKSVKKIEVKGIEISKYMGANPNIKKDMDKVDKPIEDPSKMGGYYCTVSFDNRTGLYIKIYVDGTFKGTLAPWDDGSVTVYSGYTRIYCISAGGTREWRATGDCDGEYDYQLR